MPGSVISIHQQSFLTDLFREPGLVPSVKKSEQCSVNMHGQFYIAHKDWNDGQQEDLLGGVGGITPGGEPKVHFHVAWTALHWVRFDWQPNPRIGTS